MGSEQTVGLLALQGDFAKHRERFEHLGVRVREIRTETELAGVAGLVIPGGESTTLTRLMTVPLRSALDEFAKSHAVWGTCAGMIMLSRGVADPRVAAFEWMDFEVDRNGFGRQLHSFEADLRVDPELGSGTLHGVFIRAPRIRTYGPDCRPLVWYEAEPVCIRQGRILATSFHPELTADDRLHRYFLSLIA
ncbi:pyridoxal 5'-phosphate synthase glutaminase subunit PdxT [candidate division KSB1 bacterium]|nr:pyridoxal 5'-phosphate synthase glutaminase subunit PdxT [candidate division KSB1 bacterium]